jgi:SAM-dependent methyltransferase
MRDTPFHLPVGCGNGQLLFLLAQGGYSVDCLTGIDYSESSIKLSSQIARAKGIQGLRLEVRDILRDPIEPPLRNAPALSPHTQRKGWDLITDKGVRSSLFSTHIYIYIY